MSKVKITGNASGTGVLTIEAPNTNTDRTITLPDSTGTVLMTDGDGSALTNLPAGGVDGIVSSANATAITIDSSERVGIGTGTPSADLEVSSSTGNAWTALITNTDSTDSNGVKITTNSVGSGQSIAQFWSGGVQRLKLTGDGRGLSQFTAGAWVNFKTDSGSPTLNDSHNISSIGDWGTGQFGIYIASGFSNSNYCPVGMGNDRRYMSINQDNTAPQGGRLDVYCTHANGTDYDMPTNNVVIFGDM